MPQYLLLIYGPQESAPADDPGEDPARWGAFRNGLDDAGLRLGSARLYGTEAATTVRERGGETLVTDGPFAETNEYLAGYFLLDCPNLDVALEQAARMPNIHYASVEVRPVMPTLPDGKPDEKAATQA